jgi:hypothetical protein
MAAQGIQLPKNRGRANNYVKKKDQPISVEEGEDSGLTEARRCRSGSFFDAFVVTVIVMAGCWVDCEQT